MTVPLWLILLIPIAGFVTLIFAGRRLGRTAGWLATGLIALDAVLAMSLFAAVWEHVKVPAVTYDWWSGSLGRISFGLAVDPLGALMLVVVTVVSTLVHLFSIGYMADDARFTRYFAYLQLFSASMLTLVLADGLALLFCGWELVGLSSYLLIGFWFEKPPAANAAKKAFITTRVGDVGLLAGLLLLGVSIGSYRFEDVFANAEAGTYAPAALTVAALLVFAGAVGKSAQFPLHVWLPDAMEGPTPVSALIHAATMVAAGVYLVARMFPVFEVAPGALPVVAFIGALTALMAASIAVTQDDIKKVLAYSTISQLGLMFLGLGVVAREAAMFHLFTHAGFKALLFLGAGAVIHATHEQDLRRLGGLARRMPVTATTFVLGAVALAGVPPLAGFWSKDEIVAATLKGGHQVLFAVALTVSLLTAVYATRLVLTVFFGDEPEGGPEAHADADAHGADAHGGSHAHDGDWTILAPLVLLAGVACLAGFAGAPLFGAPLQHFIALAPEEAHMDWLASGAATLVALSGIALGWLGWGRRRLAGDAWLARMGAPYRWAKAKYGIDELYETLFVRPVAAIARVGYAFDKGFIDGAVDGVGLVAVWLGTGIRRLQAGGIRRYALGMFVGAVLLVALGIISLRGIA